MQHAARFGNSDSKSITQEKFNLGISVVLRKIDNGSQNHYKDTTKEVERKSQQEVFEHFLLTFALYFFGSVLVMILGTIIYLPQYYAYSQVELLLCDTLAIGIAKPSRVLHTSRFLMKGYKFQRFVLDLQLLPWYILIWISFGIASISIFPYIYSSQIFFYQRLLEIKRRKV